MSSFVESDRFFKVNQFEDDLVVDVDEDEDEDDIPDSYSNFQLNEDLTNLINTNPNSTNISNNTTTLFGSNVQISVANSSLELVNHKHLSFPSKLQRHYDDEDYKSME